jgi:hypothetical protein
MNGRLGSVIVFVFVFFFCFLFRPPSSDPLVQTDAHNHCLSFFEACDMCLDAIVQGVGGRRSLSHSPFTKGRCHPCTCAAPTSNLISAPSLPAAMGHFHEASFHLTRRGPLAYYASRSNEGRSDVLSDPTSGFTYHTILDESDVTLMQAGGNTTFQSSARTLVGLRVMEPTPSSAISRRHCRSTSYPFKRKITKDCTDDIVSVSYD